MKTLITIISIVILLSFSLPTFAQERTIDHQIEIINLKLEVVRLKKEVFLNKVQLSMFFTNLRIEEKDLVDEMVKLIELKKKQEADKKANEGKE